ncbi:RNA polymerase sigma factor [Adonisia turfae]|uniref:Sigma-70 family RNA polymerase sigma factor n=1 Tax=Adonisia turfae CCMR0081 TaxID=2292702 RepID=A0A6M0RCL9_9CYAN|nr:sigma-70 family RNA polymerase sigma factor [Adonisia turfae]NEZ54124.1 sigma-70 family RNA polymerase sigma factor [Adonisia turfae CCMR0081]
MSHCQKSNKVQALKAKFLDEVSYILEPSNVQGKSFLNYLQRVGKQLNIRNLNPHELISDAVMRGLTYIDKNSKGIDNVQAWLRKVCSHIMYDMVKGEKRNRLLKAKNKDLPETADPFSEVEEEEQKTVLEAVLPFLSKEDQEILDLRFYRGFSYKEIQQHYLEVAEVFIKIPALRQRESRALRRLREKFWENYEGQQKGTS